MMRWSLMMLLLGLLAACNRAPECELERVEAEAMARAAAGQDWASVQTAIQTRCPQFVDTDSVQSAFAHGNTLFCEDPGNGWQQRITTPDRDILALCDEQYSAFHGAVRMADQWLGWMQEHQQLMAQAEQLEGQQRGAILAQAQRIQRDLDMLRGIADTRGYPTEELPDWRERDSLPRPDQEAPEESP